LNADELVNSVNQSIAPDSRLRHITTDDVRNWKNKGLLKSAPKYYHYDIQTVLALLQLEREVRSRSDTSHQHIQPDQTDVSRARDLEAMFQKGVIQVVTCISSSFAEEQRIIQALKDTGLVSSAGHVSVNFSLFSSQPIQIPSTGVEANEGGMSVFIADGAAGNNPNPVVTPIGAREFTEDDAFFKSICNSNSVWGYELLGGIGNLVPPEIAEQMRSAALQKKKRFVKPVYTFPIFVPILKISGMPATMVDSVYITPGGQRIPPLPTIMSLISPRLYQAFLNTNGNSMQEIVNFVADYNIILRFRFPTGDPQKEFYTAQQRMREVLAEAHSGHLSFADARQLSPSHEDVFVEDGFVQALLLVPDYADYISEVQRVFGPQEHNARFIPVRRYYSWLDYMWAEILEDITGGLIPPLCKGCGKVLTLSQKDKRGRRREYCMDCEPTRGIERVRRNRSKLKLK
jgi:hypothetical protein